VSTPLKGWTVTSAQLPHAKLRAALCGACQAAATDLIAVCVEDVTPLPVPALPQIWPAKKCATSRVTDTLRNRPRAGL
jgi:hypothetical protein